MSHLTMHPFLRDTDADSDSAMNVFSLFVQSFNHTLIHSYVLLFFILNQQQITQQTSKAHTSTLHCVFVQHPLHNGSPLIIYRHVPFILARKIFHTNTILFYQTLQTHLVKISCISNCRN